MCPAAEGATADGGAVRVERGQLSRREPIGAGRGAIRIGRIALVGEKAVSEIVARDRANDGLILSLPHTLKAEKEKYPIFLDGTTDKCSVRVAKQEGRAVGKAALNLRGLDEPVVPGKGGTVILVGAAVPIVSSALGHQSDLPTRGTARIRVRVGCCHPEFLKRIQRNTDGSLQPAGSLIVVIGAVEGHVGLVAAAAVHRAATAIGVEAALRGAVDLVHVVAGERDAGLEGQDAGGLATFKGQSLNLLGIKDVPHRGVIGVDQGGGSVDLDGFYTRCHLKGYVQSGGGAHQELDIRLFDGGESARLHGELISRGRELKKLIFPLTVGRHVARKCRGGIGEGDDRANDDRAFCVGDDTVQRSCRGLRRGETGKHEERADQYCQLPRARRHGKLLWPQEGSCSFALRLPRGWIATEGPGKLMGRYCAMRRQ